MAGMDYMRRAASGAAAAAWQGQAVAASGLAGAARRAAEQRANYSAAAAKTSSKGRAAALPNKTHATPQQQHTHPQQQAGALLRSSAALAAHTPLGVNTSRAALCSSCNVKNLVQLALNTNTLEA